MSDEKPLDPASEQVIAKARRLMLIATTTTLIALAIVLGVIGYRVSRQEGSAPPAAPDVSAAVPAGAKVVSTAIGDGRLAITIETAGGTEVRVFNVRTMQPLGRIQLTPKP
jgi:hypothetical protein